jgi:Flp pilus assembly protein TadG
MLAIIKRPIKRVGTEDVSSPSAQPHEFLQAEDGVTAVEFALVAAPFFALLFAILETSLAFFAQQVLQTATTESARLIMTGTAQTNGMTAAQFQQAVCNNAVALFSCGGVYVNVQKFNSFGSATQLNPLVAGNFNPALMNYTPGGPGDIVVVQVFYVWPVDPAPLGFSLSNMNGNNHLLVGTAVFRNEPY